MIRLAPIAAAALSLAGCANDGSFEPTIPLMPVEIVSDNYCAISRKVSWDVTDTWQTIDEARRHNERIDKLCPADTPARTSPPVKTVS